MRPFNFAPALFAALILAGCSSPSAKIQPPWASPTAKADLRDEWIDADTGHRVVRLSRLPGASESFYFHQNAFTAEGDKLVFENTLPRQKSRLVALDLATKKIGPLTEPGSRHGFVGPRSRTVYHQRGRRDHRHEFRADPRGHQRRLHLEQRVALHQQQLRHLRLRRRPWWT